MLLFTEARGSVEHVEGDDHSPSETELAENRACFRELAKNGCDDPGENPREFRSCMHDVYPKLSESCQKLMSELYRRR